MRSRFESFLRRAGAGALAGQGCEKSAGHEARFRSWSPWLALFATPSLVVCDGTLFIVQYVLLHHR